MEEEKGLTGAVVHPVEQGKRLGYEHTVEESPARTYIHARTSPQ